MSLKKRNNSALSKRPKEKICYLYEQLSKGENPQNGNPEFWAEFFLLTPNAEALEVEILKSDAEHLSEFFFYFSFGLGFFAN